jgi:hypothetical protein
LNDAGQGEGDEKIGQRMVLYGVQLKIGYFAIPDGPDGGGKRKKILKVDRE